MKNLGEYNFAGFVKDLQQKFNGDKYLKAPHTVISFAMVPPMNQEVFEKIVEEIVMQSQFATLGIQTKPKIENKNIGLCHFCLDSNVELVNGNQCATCYEKVGKK